MPELVSPSAERPKDIEHDIAVLETRLCPTEPQKLLLASRLIDFPFLAASVLGGEPKSERAFGDLSWRNYLAAYEMTLDTNGDLTPELMVDIHRQFACDDGKLGQSPSIDWGFGISTLSIYAQITPEAEAAVAQNPHIEFMRTTKVPPQAIDMQHYKQDGREQDFFEQRLLKSGRVADVQGEELILSYRLKSPEQKMQAMQHAIDQYQTGIEDSATRAANLQHTLISIHPFMVDYNGRTTRMVLDRELRKNGQSPALLTDFNDLYRTPEAWAQHVKNGQAFYQECEARVAAGETDPVVIFGLQQLRDNFAKLSYDTQLRFAQELQKSPEAHPDDLEVATNFLRQLGGSALST